MNPAEYNAFLEHESEQMKIRIKDKLGLKDGDKCRSLYF